MAKWGQGLFVVELITVHFVFTVRGNTNSLKGSNIAKPTCAIGWPTLT